MTPRMMGPTIVHNGKLVALADQEVVVDALVVQVMDDGGQHCCQEDKGVCSPPSQATCREQHELAL